MVCNGTTVATSAMGPIATPVRPISSSVQSLSCARSVSPWKFFGRQSPLRFGQRFDKIGSQTVMFKGQRVVAANYHIIGAGQRMRGEMVADQRAETALNAVTLYRAAQTFGSGDAISRCRIIITARAGEQHECGHRHAHTSVGGKKLGAPRQTADGNRLRQRASCGLVRGGCGSRRDHQPSPCGRESRDGGREQGC